MENTRFAMLLVLALVWSTCGSGSSGPKSVLPGSNAVDSWKLAEDPIVVDTEAGFYQLIDGGAPKYMDRGWVGSAIAVYRKGDEYLQVAVNDMGTPQNAEAMFHAYFPTAAIPVSSRLDNDPAGLLTNAIIDQGRASSYGAYAFSHQYYIELNINARTDAALADLKSFLLAMLDRTQ